MLSTSQECSIRQPTSCLEQHFQGSGDSIPRRFSWFGDDSLPVVLLPTQGNARHGCTGTQLAPGPVQICASPVSLLAQTMCKIREDEEQVLLVAPYWPNRTCLLELILLATAPPLADSFEEGSAFLETGHPLAPASRSVDTPCVVSERDVKVLGDLPQEVSLTINSVRAPSTRRAYALKCNLFVKWCSSHHEDPQRCSIRAVLSFLEHGLEHKSHPSFGWDVKPRSWLSVVIKNPMALLVKNRGVTAVSWPNSHHWPLSIMAS